MDVRIVGFGVLAGCLVLVWEEKLFEFGVGDVVGEGPGYASLAARSTSRTVCLEQCAIDSMVRWLY